MLFLKFLMGASQLSFQGLYPFFLFLDYSVALSVHISLLALPFLPCSLGNSYLQLLCVEKTQYFIELGCEGFLRDHNWLRLIKHIQHL